jgi:hypothetical protein
VLKEHIRRYQLLCPTLYYDVLRPLLQLFTFYQGGNKSAGEGICHIKEPETILRVRILPTTAWHQHPGLSIMGVERTKGSGPPNMVSGLILSMGRKIVCLPQPFRVLPHRSPGVVQFLP